MTRLCQVCEAISFEALPAFPQDDYDAGLTGKQYIQRFTPKNWPLSSNAAEETARVKHHASLESLREAASNGCELCKLIQEEAEKLLAELDGLEDRPDGRGKPYPSPSFDMWLTQRPEGGRGFWVVSEPSQSKGGTVILPIAAFGVVVEEDDPLASIICGRPIKATVAAADLERVRRCVEECDREHDSCHWQPRGLAPQRLLDLQASTSKPNETVKLVDLGNTEQEKYAALSYASDAGIVSCLEPSLLVDGAEIQVANLPQTFQDAIPVTRALNVRYLWIDSLCVPGNLSEWDRASPQAGSVYSNAYVTISATGATDALGGLFVSRPEPRYVQVPYKTENGTLGTALAFRLPLAKEVIRSRYIEMREEPISKGVWSFQERVLSSRVVHFASDQVYVECMRQFVSEDGLLERQRYHTNAETLPDGVRHHFSQELILSPKERWFDMLWDYARREPAVPTDKLTALSNVARAFQRMNDGGRGEYIAGHWKDSFLESLCWQSLKCKPAGDSDAPSWSWISVDGIPAMGFGTDIPSYLATVVATRVRLQDATNPFGRVTEASITLEAPPLIPLRIVEEHEFGEGSNVFGQVYVQSESESGERIYAGLDTVDRRLAVSANALREMKLFALVLAETRPDGECRHACPGSEETLHGLIVTPAQAAGEKTVRRLGFFLADRSDLGPGSLFDSREVTTLV